ncbi:monoamine oxidase [Macrophomina phaseolina]|uniref:Amine oxidase n=1 Tax=Macrophomina phaseolina TaxID=35725 RepID=A0ABQ8GFB4_9PEZI|nr:monoamine oxidase [Macrophomina phaseolina]
MILSRYYAAATAVAAPVLCLAYPDQTVDVAIIGAGLSGLSTAKDLVAAGKSVVILEARDRVGGRILNAHLSNGGITEIGAQFVGPTQDRVLKLADDLRLPTFKAHDTGNTTLWRNNAGSTFDSALTGSIPPLDDTSLAEAAAALQTLNTFASQLDVNAPWEHPNATEWDSETFETWIDREVSLSGPRALFSLATTSIFSTQPRELSLLYVLAYTAAAGNATTKGTFERLIGVAGAAQESRIVGGTQLLAIKLAERFQGRVVLNAPVRRIEQTGSIYTITADNTAKVTAKHVVVAMSPPLASRITYSPPLPASRDQLTQRMPMGAIGKAIAIYATPFWRAAGLNGQVNSDSGVVRATFDNSPPNGTFGAIMGFLEADEARMVDAWSEDEIEAAVVKDYVRYFGPAAANVTQWVIQRWDREEFSRGGPVAYAPPGVLTQYGPALRQPVGNIHFAGTETSPYWTGYMDGAVRSGERAAKEILVSV